MAFQIKNGYFSSKKNGRPKIIKTLRKVDQEGRHTFKGKIYDKKLIAAQLRGENVKFGE